MFPYHSIYEFAWWTSPDVRMYNQIDRIFADKKDGIQV
jgi:hypothetical protein